jgi:DNA-directed RNA polymerase specialized sigma24 family protein
MEFRVHNTKIIENKEQRRTAERIIEKQSRRLQNIGSNYPKPLRLNIHFNKSDRINYLISGIIKLSDGVVFVKEKGDNIESILYILFDKLKVSLNRKINKERKDYLRRSRNRHHKIFNEHLYELQELKKADTRATFNELLKILLSDVAIYVKRRIKSAEMTTAIRKGKFKRQEILDDIYLHIYDHLDELPGDEGLTRIWLYQIADRIMTEKFREIEFEREHFERIAEIVDAEYASLEEKYSVDADEEIVPLEEIDGYELSSNLNMATVLYQEDENSLLDEITLKINKEDITKLLEQELDKLPILERTIMEFYLIHQMSVHEIAEIKRMPENEIENLTGRICKDLKRVLSFVLMQR